MSVMMTATFVGAFAWFQDEGELPAWLGRDVPENFDAAVSELERRFREAGAKDVDVRPIPEVEGDDARRLLNRVRSNLSELNVQARLLDGLAKSHRDIEGDAGSNVIVELAGRGERRILIAAPLGTPEFPLGMGDSWSACALLPHLYAHFATQPLEHSLTFAAFGGEAYGHRGARSFVRRMGEDMDVFDAVLVVQGLGTSDPNAWDAGSSQALLLCGKLVSQRIDVPLQVRSFVDIEHVAGISDLIRGAGVPALFLDGLDLTKVQLRGPADVAATLDPEVLARTVQFVQETLVEMDQFQLRINWKGALEVYQMERKPALELLTTVRYRLLGPNGPERVEDVATAQGNEGAESMSPSRRARKARRAKDETPPGEAGDENPPGESGEAKDEKSARRADKAGPAKDVKPPRESGDSGGAEDEKTSSGAGKSGPDEPESPSRES